MKPACAAVAARSRPQRAEAGPSEMPAMPPQATELASEIWTRTLAVLAASRTGARPAICLVDAPGASRWPTDG